MLVNDVSTELPPNRMTPVPRFLSSCGRSPTSSNWPLLSVPDSKDSPMYWLSVRPMTGSDGRTTIVAANVPDEGPPVRG